MRTFTLFSTGKWIACMTLLFQCLLSQGQILENSNALSEYKRIKAQEMYLNSDLSSILGSPYLTEEFVKAKVKNLKGDSISVALRYNAFQDEMEYKVDKQVYWIDKLNTKSVQIDNDTYVPISYQKGNSVVTAYFRLITPGKYSLLVRTAIVYAEAEHAMGYNEAKPNRFEKKDAEFYIRQENQQPVLIKSKKDLLGGFPSLNESLSIYISKNKPKINKEKDLIQLVNFLNSGL